MKMNLKEAILNCNSFEDTEEYLNVVFAQEIEGKFLSNSNALVLEIAIDEIESLKINEIKDKYCPTFSYFLEMNILRDFYNDLVELEEYKSDERKVARLIYYAENDA